MTEASTEGSAASPAQLERKPRRCCGKTAKDLPCKLYVKNGLYCPYHGKREIERWNAALAEELVKRRRERLGLSSSTKPLNEYGGMVLRPPIVPPPQNTKSVEMAAVPGLLAAMAQSAASALARLVLWAWIAAAAFVPMLAIGAVGIFVMVFIGAGVEMLSMAAY